MLRVRASIRCAYISRVYGMCLCYVCVYVCVVCVCARCLHPAGAINLQFRVENKGWESFDFTCALHTYFAVDDIDSCSVEGLEGARLLLILRGSAARAGPPCCLAVVLRSMQALVPVQDP
jgi:hypothetical protein